MKKRRWQIQIKALFPDRQSVILFVAALLVAAVYWGVTISEQKSINDFSVPVQFVNLPGDQVLVGPDVHKKVTVEVRGTPEMLKRMRPEDVEAKIDVSKLKPGPQMYDISKENVRLPSSVELVKVMPGVLHFTIDKKIKRSVPLHPKFQGRVADGYQILKWSIDPPDVVLQGPASILRRTERVDTQPVQLDSQDQSFQASVVPTLSDPDIEVLNPEPHTLRVQIGEKRMQRVITPVPIQVSGANRRYNVSVTPTSIKVMVDGPESVVKRLTPSDIQAEVDVQGLTPSSQSYQLRPAVRFANSTLGQRVEITSWVQRFVQVQVDRMSQAPTAPQKPVPPTPQESQAGSANQPQEGSGAP